MSRLSLSGIILAKDASNINETTLKSLQFCDEIIVIADDNVNGANCQAILRHNVKIIKRALNADFAGQRNFALERTAGDWVLFVDADEEVSKQLKEEIVKLLNRHIVDNKDKSVAYYIKRRDFWWGRELKFGEVVAARNKGLIRLVKKDSGRWYGKVHEVFKADGQCRHLEYYLNHYPHPRLKDFLEEINFYSTLRANELKEAGKKGSLFEILIYPPAKFIVNYFLRLGFLDGAAGFAYSFIMSFHSFLVRAKLYQYTKLNKKCY